MAERWEPLEADFQRFFHLDLRFEVERTGARRLCALVEGLPADAAVWRDDGFTRGEELAAIAVERADAWGKALWEIAARSHLKEPPKEIGNPGVIEIPRPGQGTDEGAATAAEQKPERTPEQMSRKRASLFT